MSPAKKRLTKVTLKEHWVSSGGEKIYLREKYTNVTGLGDDRVVLFVHGATFPGESTFDVNLRDYSWMEFLAKRGLDAFALDVRGYGRSTGPPESGASIVGPETAMEDIDSTVNYVLRLRNVAKVSLIGLSWGSSTSALYAQTHEDKVERLLLCAPGYRNNDLLAQALGAEEEALRTHSYLYRTGDELKARWDKELAYDGQREQNVLGKTIQLILQSDATSKRRSPPSARYPTGAWRDIHSMFRDHKPPYDPTRIKAPTLIARGALDTFSLLHDAVDLYRDLASEEKALVTISGGGHFLHLERPHLKLFEYSATFLSA